MAMDETTTPPSPLESAAAQPSHTSVDNASDHACAFSLALAGASHPCNHSGRTDAA